MSQTSLLVRISSLFLAFLLITPTAVPAPGIARWPLQSAPSAASPLLQAALAALSPQVAITDITFSGSVEYIAGSDDETGTFTIKAMAPGASRISLSLPSGQRTEILNRSANPPVGSWTGPDGTSHPVAYHNILGEPVWICPFVTINAALSNPQSVTVYVGPETKNDAAVQHVSVHQMLPGAADGAPLFQHLTQIDVYLDSSTSLPSVVDFRVHPDNNAGIDIPVEIRFSDYRIVNGAQVPFHIQKYVNGSLYFDFQSSSVVINSGVSPSAFSAQ